MMTPAERVLRARQAAYAMHAKHSIAETTVAGLAVASQAALAHFCDVADPNHELEPAERLRRGKAAQRAHLAGIALKSSKLRRRRRAQVELLAA